MDMTSASPATNSAAKATAPSRREGIARRFFGWLLPVLILGLGLGGFVALGGPKAPPRKDKEPPKALPVRTVAVQRQDSGIDLELDGVVVPLREVTLAAEVAGRVLRKTEDCNEGRIVTKGTVLFEIDPRDYQLDVSRLEREVAQAGLAIEEVDEELVQNGTSADLARRQLDLARREVARLEGLKAGRIVTESDADRAVRDELTAANALTMLEGQKRVLAKRRNRLIEGQSLAETMLAKAKLDLARTTIVSPVDGVIVEDKVEQDSFVAKGAPLVTIEDTSATEVKTSLRMDEVARVWGSQVAETTGRGLSEVPARVVFAIGDRRYEWDGVLSRQEGRGLDEKTRTLPCRVRVPDPTVLRAIDRYGAVLPQLPADAPRSLLRGMFVEVWLHVDVPAALVSLPHEAVRPTGDVLVMRDGRLAILRPRPFHSTDRSITFSESDSGLLPGDRVVVSQVSNPRDGMELTEAEK
ncbi:MAG: HlyD family efflux transporter periplasmic adaptor subunit [Planctomycetes bacterium]|nr:HlyD family efflux transporter periplasmic adaptor subunit [Planctomycetota bacterium]